MKRLIFAILLVIPAFAIIIQARSQSPGPEVGNPIALSLSGALELAEQGNFDLRLAEHETEQAEADFRKSSSVFLPQVQFSESFLSTDDPLMAFGLRLKQERVTQADFDPALLNNPSTLRNFSTKIEVRQPLFNLDGFFGRHAAGRAAGAAKAKSERIRRGTELAVKSAYFGLGVALSSLDAVSAALAAAEGYRAQAADFLERGMIRESDFLMADVRVLELEMKKVEAENAIRDAGDDLGALLGLPDTLTILPTDTLALLAVGDLAYDEEDLFTSRSDMRSVLDGIDAAAAGLRMQRAGWLPTLNAFGSFELNGDRLTGAGARSWTAGATLQWAIFSGFDRIGEIQKASAKRSALETQYRKMRSTGSREIASALRGLESARRRVELSARAVTRAAESFRVLSDRFGAGLERTPDLLQAEATLLDARLNHLQSIYRHNATIFMIEFLLERKVTL